jgi:hypothetical protein
LIGAELSWCDRRRRIPRRRRFASAAGGQILPGQSWEKVEYFSPSASIYQLD